MAFERSPVTGEFPAQMPVTRTMFPFDDVIMWQHTMYVVLHITTSTYSLAYITFSLVKAKR